MKFWWAEDICIVSKYLAPKYLIITKGKIVTFKWRNLADTILTSWLQLTSVTSWCDAATRIHHHLGSVCLPKGHNLNLLMKKHQTTPTLAIIFQKLWYHRRQRLRNCPRLKRVGYMTTKCNHNQGLHPGPGKGKLQ